MLLQRLYWTAYLAWCIRSQKRCPFRPLAAIYRDQERRVQRMVAHAYGTVPYYRETMDRLGLSPVDFCTADDLAKLPILEREQLQRDPEYFFSSAYRPERCLCTRTSGSSGAPIAVYYDMASLVETMAHAERPRPILAKVIGRTFGYRETFIASPASNLLRMSRFCRERTLLPEGTPTRSQLLFVSDSPERNAAEMDVFKPDLVLSFGSYFEMLCPYWLESGRRHHLPKVIAYGGDSLSDTVRRLITEELKIHVTSGYQAVEASRIGFECERHTGIHLNVDIHPVRIVDAQGRSRPPGESGDVVVSTLANRATVLLNYRLGDTAALRPTPCPCGRSLPLLSFPQGRCHDQFELPTGQLVSAFVVAGVFLQRDPIWQYQVVQETPSHFRVSLIVGSSCDRADIRRHVAEGFAKALGKDITTDIEFVDSFPRTPTGKHRSVRSLLPRAQRRMPGEEPPAQETRL